MSEIKITYGSLENAILKDSQFVFGYVDHQNSSIISNSSGAFANGYATKGYSINASGIGAFINGIADGGNIIADASGSHAEGYNTKAKGIGSHAEGYNTLASGIYSHAEGYNTQTTASYTHASGLYTIANQETMTAIGKYNKTYDIANTSTLFVVGNGTGQSTNNRKNAFEVINNASTSVRATVNNIQNVELGLPIGSITMWAGNDTPDGWLLCNGVGVPVDTSVHGYKSIACTIQNKYMPYDYLTYFAHSILANNGIHKFGDGYYIRRTSITTDQIWIKSYNINGTTINISEFTNDINDAYIFNHDGSEYTFKYSLTTISVTSYRCILLPNFQQKFPLGAKANSSIGIDNNLGINRGWSTKIGSIGGEDRHKLGQDEISGGGSYVSSEAGGTVVVDYSNIVNNSSHNNIPPFLAINFIIKYK